MRMIDRWGRGILLGNWSVVRLCFWNIPLLVSKPDFVETSELEHLFMASDMVQS